jgi:hypothetical protein
MDAKEAVAEVLNVVGNKLGVASVATNVGLAASFNAGLIQIVDTWSLSDTAIVVSMGVSVMWCLKLWMDYKLSKLNYEIKMKEKNSPDKA